MHFSDKMTSKNKKIKIPQTALAFYIKLYCDRKGSSDTKYHSNLIEATKSWLSLSEAEKQQFCTKFKECENKHKQNFFSQFKNAEPFMKKKEEHLREVDSTILSNSEEIHEHKTEDVVSEQWIEQTEEIAIEQSNFGSEAADPSTLELQEHSIEQDENKIERIDKINEEPHTTLMEPIPPTIRTGHELYCMLNTNDSVTWASLPRFEKNRYSRAVSIMKKDYISKYKEYLLSLTPIELFNHYIKVI